MLFISITLGGKKDNPDETTKIKLTQYYLYSSLPTLIKQKEKELPR